MRELIEVAKNNIEKVGVNYVRATIENNILDEIIAGKISSNNDGIRNLEICLILKGMED